MALWSSRVPTDAEPDADEIHRRWQKFLANRVVRSTALVVGYCAAFFPMSALPGSSAQFGAVVPLVVIASWLGMRGGITLALVLILPTELPYWWTIQAIAYGVVLFDLFVLAPNAGRLIRWHNTPHNLHH